MPVGVLGSSWDDAFGEDTPPRDVPEKVRAALQEGVGKKKKKGKKPPVFQWECDVEWLGWGIAAFIAVRTKLPKKFPPPGLWGIKLMP